MKSRAILSSWLIAIFIFACEPEHRALPNIVIIYADDMGYGDLACQNENSRIPTPNLDRLASQGMRFTDAHSSSGICSPSRWAMLTGTYHWRRQHDIVNSFGRPFFRDTDYTLPNLLKESGYTTACIGKWHLGWDWDFKSDPSGEIEQWGRPTKVYLPGDVNWESPVSGGPLDRGFDYYFGDGTINFPPYTWVENDRVLKIPTEVMYPGSVGYDTKEGNWEFRPGPKATGWNPYEVLPTLTQKTLDWIGKQDQKRPFFLYFALPSPHAPIIPNDEFDGKSQAGAYGDFVFQTDWVVGEVLKALEMHGLEDNTIVVFSSDNGPEAYAWERAVTYGHFSMGDFRGLKRDVWEGGHHVPMIVKWPGRIREGSVSEALVAQMDLMATFAAVVGAELPIGTAPDSFDMLSVWFESQEAPRRNALVHNTYESIWGVRESDWLFIDGPTGGHRVPPPSFRDLRDKQLDFQTEGLLFNMRNDPGQTLNLFEDHPDRVHQLKALLAEIRAQSLAGENSLE